MALNDQHLFKPVDAGTKSISATTTTARVALSLAQAFPDDLVELRVLVAPGGSTAFIRFGGSSVNAAVTDIPIPPGIPCGFSVDPLTVTNVAAITATGTATVYITPGSGQ